jgi:hypothetical protein
MRVLARLSLAALLVGKLSGCADMPSAAAPAEPDVPIQGQAPASRPEPDLGLAALLTATGIGSPIGLIVP